MAKKTSFIKNLFNGPEDENDTIEDEFYNEVETNKKGEIDNGNKMILMEPRAFSESQQIANYLKGRNSVVVNLKRVTSDQAKRIIDFLSGCIYAIGGTMQKVGVGIYLCAPKNVKVDGEITEENGKGSEEEDW